MNRTPRRISSSLKGAAAAIDAATCMLSVLKLSTDLRKSSVIYERHKPKLGKLMHAYSVYRVCMI